MFRPRIIPCLLLQRGGLVKTVKFKDPVYIGDPINAIKIFNEKEVDELIFLDISTTVDGVAPRLDIMGEIASECFMPVCYGGGIRDINEMRKIFSIGIEKIAISSYAIENPGFIRECAGIFGSQSIVVSLDVRKSLWGKHEIVTHNGRKRTGLDPLSFTVEMAKMGAGELLINSVDRDGTMKGYDIDLIKNITGNVDIPVIASGGAGKMSDIREVLDAGEANSAAAGSMFVFQGKHRAVLISYPNPDELEDLVSQVNKG